MFTQREESTAAASKRGRSAASVRALLAIAALGALSAASGCDQVKNVAKSAQEAVQKVLKPKPQQGNPNPAPAPAPTPTEPTPEGPVVLTPGETPPVGDNGAATPPADSATPPANGGTAEPTPPGTTEPATPATPGTTEPSTPSTPGTTEPANPGTTTPPSTGGGTTPTPPATPMTPGEAVDNAAGAFANPGGFLYRAVGKLAAGSGEGAKDETIYAPGIVFPVKNAPTFLNSQVYGVGGMNGAAGSECAAANYGYPWADNFCEKRPGANRASYNCPSKQIHQGQDIRAGDSAFCTKVKKMATAERKGAEIVAVEDGVIQYIGSYTVDLRSSGRIYRYLHMNMKQLKVKLGDSVTKGQTLGFMSNDFGVDAAGKPIATTLHLHFEVKQNIDGIGWTWVSPYMSLVTAYKAQHPEGALAQ